MVPTVNEANQCTQTLIYIVLLGIFCKHCDIEAVKQEWRIYILRVFYTTCFKKPLITMKTKSKQEERIKDIKKKSS